MSWRSALPTVNLFAIIFLLGLYAQRSSKTRQAIDRDDGSVEFPPDLVVLLAMPIIGLLPAWDTFNRHGSGDRWNELTLASLLFAVGVLLFNLPGTVVVAHDGIEQRFWLRGEKRIRWGEIAEIKNRKSAGRLTIIGSDGTKIVYSEKLGDRPRFLEEIEKHAPGRLPLDVRAGSILKLHGEEKSGWLRF